MPPRLSYLHLRPDGVLPECIDGTPFRSVVIIQADVTWGWRAAVSEWLVGAGCLYMMAWGPDCSLWDDAVNEANLERFDHGDIPEDKFVMTTWHNDESLREVCWFAKTLAAHPTVDLHHTLLLHIAPAAAEAEMLAAFEDAKD